MARCALQLEVKKVLEVEISRERFPEIMTAQDLMDEIAQLLRDKPEGFGAPVGADSYAELTGHRTEPTALRDAGVPADVDVALG